jgi:hypothetical protein
MNLTTGTVIEDDVLENRTKSKGAVLLLEQKPEWREHMDKAPNKWVVLEIESINTRNLSRLRNRVTRMNKRYDDYTFTSRSFDNAIAFLGKRI